MNNKINKNIINTVPLNDYERELEEFLSKGEYVDDKNLESTKEMFSEAAKRHRELTETRSITLRVKNEDLIKTKVKAKKNQIPYQTIINLLINRYAKGEIDISI